MKSNPKLRSVPRRGIQRRTDPVGRTVRRTDKALSILLLTHLAPSEVQIWRDRIRAELPKRDRLFVYGEPFNAKEIDVAVVTTPPTGILATLPNLKLIHSLWAGVDSLLADPTLPRDVPLVRLVDPVLTSSMTEAVVLHVLTLHRNMPEYRKRQAAKQWLPLQQPRASERKVGVLGMGNLGRAAAVALRYLGFDVAGWSSRPAKLEGIAGFSGQKEFASLLGRSDILVNLLPLTSETRGILNAHAFSQMPKNASLINVARGAHLVERDLLVALDTGHLAYAILDAFEKEPLDPAHPFWTHPAVAVMPHVAARTDLRSASKILVKNLQRFREGAPLEDLVDPQRGY